MREKISVVIPCYNVEKYIDRCLASVVAQTIGMEMLEIICVNDASMDGTWEKLSWWERRYPENILLVNCKENGAQGRARNVALSHATGDFVTFLDSDDWIELDTYERMYHALKTYHCDIACCGWIPDAGREDIWNSKQKRKGQDYMLEVASVKERKKFLVTGVMGHMCVNKMYRSSLIYDNHLFFLEKCKYEDIYWGVLNYFYGNRIYFINEIMYHYFRNADSTIMTRNAPYHMDMLDVVLRLWQECKNRGLLETYYLEMELNFLIHYYLGGVRMLVLRFEDLKYEIFQKMCTTVMETVPNYKENPYVKEILSEIDQLQIALIDQDISRAQFADVTELLRGKIAE